MKEALANGASKEEIMETLELTSTLGIHACNIGVPLLVEVMKELGGYESHLEGKNGREKEREKLKEEFTKKRGYWHEFWEDFLRLDPEFFGAYLEYSTVPWVKGKNEGDGGSGGVLEPKVCELLVCGDLCVCLLEMTGQGIDLLCV